LAVPLGVRGGELVRTTVPQAPPGLEDDDPTSAIEIPPKDMFHPIDYPNGDADVVEDSLVNKFHRKPVVLG
jgi:hypothetical protein